MEIHTWHLLSRCVALIEWHCYLRCIICIQCKICLHYSFSFIETVEYQIFCHITSIIYINYLVQQKLSQIIEGLFDVDFHNTINRQFQWESHVLHVIIICKGHVKTFVLMVWPSFTYGKIQLPNSSLYNILHAKHHYSLSLKLN